MQHYWKALGKTFAECCPHQSWHDNQNDGEYLFAEGFLSGTWQTWLLSANRRFPVSKKINSRTREASLLVTNICPMV